MQGHSFRFFKRRILECRSKGLKTHLASEQAYKGETPNLQSYFVFPKEGKLIKKEIADFQEQMRWLHRRV